MYKNVNVMKRIILILLGGLTALSVHAQDASLSPYEAYQIKKNIEVEILEVKRVAKYGWDNLEIKYKLTNNSDYDLQKFDFMIHLVDKKGHEIGTVDAFAFGIEKNSTTQLRYVETMSSYAHMPIDIGIPETYQLDVILDDKFDNQTASVSKVISVK